MSKETVIQFSSVARAMRAMGRWFTASELAERTGRSYAWASKYLRDNRDRPHSPLKYERKGRTYAYLWAA